MRGTAGGMSIPPDDPRLMPISLRAELLAIGHTDRSIRHALRAGSLARIRHGAYADGPTWTGQREETQYAVRSRAALLQSRTDVVLSHTSALPFLDAPVWGLGLDEVHLTRRDERSGRRESGVRQHGGVLLDDDVVRVHGIDVVSPIRAILEVASIGSVEATLVVANHFLHHGECTVEVLEDRYRGSMERWPGSLRTDLALRLVDPRIESVGETRLSYLLWREHFPRPVSQFEVYDGEDLVAQLDFALPELGVWIEFDGRVKYEKYRRPGESIADVVVREKGRENRVCELTGWRCLRVTWADLARPDLLARRLRDLIDSVARQRRAAR
ncbi:hypothetical protein FXB39_19000 [Nocardioides sp. BGMRC 2183]|nr:hypothetical protein FXB39_19000 [Nocardioides sp. BGMRC 2183]